MNIYKVTFNRNDGSVVECMPYDYSTEDAKFLISFLDKNGYYPLSLNGDLYTIYMKTDSHKMDTELYTTIRHNVLKKIRTDRLKQL